MAFHPVASAADLWSGEMVRVDRGQVPVLLVNVEGVVYAYRDRCAHQGLPLSRGRLDGTVLTCSAHHWQYDVCSGRGVNPRQARLTPLAVRIEGDQILVDLDGRPVEDTDQPPTGA
jgi:toluene monooxygenase system ferredoxin subunit